MLMKLERERYDKDNITENDTGIGFRRTFCVLFYILIFSDFDKSSPTIQRSYLRCGAR
jgi:hypothetical protein